MCPVRFVRRSFSKTTSAQDVGPLLFLNCSSILESFLYQGALNINNNNKKSKQHNSFFFYCPWKASLFHSKHGCIGCSQCRWCRSARSLRHWEGQCGEMETLCVDLRPVVLWSRMLAFEYVKMFLADAKPYYLQFITYESSPSIQRALYNFIV